MAHPQAAVAPAAPPDHGDRGALAQLPRQCEAALLDVHATWVAYGERERAKAAAADVGSQVYPQHAGH
jgi:hypothetical protein